MLLHGLMAKLMRRSPVRCQLVAFIPGDSQKPAKPAHAYPAAVAAYSLSSSACSCTESILSSEVRALHDDMHLLPCACQRADQASSMQRPQVVIQAWPC